MKGGEGLSVLLHFLYQRAGVPAVRKAGVQLPLHILIAGIPRQHLIRHAAGDQAGEVQAAKQSLFIGLFAHEPLKLSRAGNALAEQVDGIAFGLSGIAQDKHVLARQQGNGDDLDQIIPLRHLRPDFLHPGAHFGIQGLVHCEILPFYVLLR